MINFLNKKAERDIIYVLDFLLQISVNGKAIAEARNIDLEFYNLLNKPEVNQNIFHVGCLPTSREDKSVDRRFAEFVKNLTLFIEYDVRTDFIWANVAEDDNKQKEIHQKVVTFKKNILDYLLNKETISSEEYSRLLSVGVKKLNE
ncbi:hypothetical protein GW943_02550 [Candidatus Parcubacteria bacterium]|uniref:Uncharacterized protein n=1 Tax=Candidatus Kaiserbacteria bacterium CG10_big_fil_rev_8_21_14_0_10_47_16 TaxID=1974608 RepID=A0A2H0UDL6_9BACT|nr:hypothetical protein [Candidatus Parcubacteria bacterium]PIR84481.1 MAG: hypothetical protein COU16_02795 [Candidatus Kaiserbacteria bacterium CG10_big_fil_rev_8_21_14_0_10_47_16]